MRKSNNQSTELRPRRRASQTYFFKYQLARNPLKAEEEDLKLALLASLQHCNGTNGRNGTSKQTSEFTLKSCHPTKHQTGNKNNGNSNTTTTSSNNKSRHNNTNGCSTSTKAKKSDQIKHQPLPSTTDKKIKPSSLSNATSATSAAAVVSTATSKPEPDEEYLEKYKPETEDFLAFICFRTTAPTVLRNNPNSDPTTTTSNGWDKVNTTSNYPTKCSHSIPSNGVSVNTNVNHNNNNNINDNNSKLIEDKNIKQHNSIDSHNLRQITPSPGKSNNHHCSPTITDYYSPNLTRRPTRQSPRLANLQKKISENESSNHCVMGISSTAFYDNSITYEEDMKRASIALEDMAQEINSSDGMKRENAQKSPDCISKLSSSPYKNNKHLVKGLMTREFAGAFADEDTIFESISNHKL